LKKSAKNDTCVFTVAYPLMEKWIPQFTESLLKQSLKDFDLVIVNDGLDLKMLNPLEQKFNCIILPSGGSIAKNRSAGFSGILNNGYRYVIFADADDLMAENRISISKRLLDDYDIVVNDLTLINPNGEYIMDQYLSARLGSLKRINLNEILDYNFIGLGNSSARVEILHNIIIPENIEAVDWYLFSLLLYRGHNAVFTSSTSTLYRQHHSNLIGLNQLDENNILLLAEQKYLHYFYLQNLSEHHQNRFIEFSKLVVKLKDPIFRKKYLEKMSDQEPEYPFWFESIKPD
jgi:glycosyltransferase involved in cell wall biosynthesis